MEIVDSDTKNLTSQGTSAGRVVGSMGGDSGDKINDVIIVPSEAVGMIIGKGKRILVISPSACSVLSAGC